MISLPITGTVDPGFLAGLEALKRAQDAAGTSSEAAGRKAEASGPAWARAFDAIGTGAMHFNSIRAAISSAASTIGAFADEVTRLATEQGRLDDMSRQLGLNFDEAAEAAGRFADETEAMGVAGRFAAADIRLTQSELNAVMRVAGSASTMLGTTTAGAVEQLQEALVRGREGGLQRFGAGLAAVAGEGHTLQERLAALVVQAGHTAAATDTAADSVARFRDSMEDSQRVAASAFSTELARLGSVAQNARSASEGVADLNRNLAAAGQTMALAVAAISGGMGVIVGSVGAALGALGQVASFTIPGGMGGGLNRLAGDLRRASQGLAVDSANGLMAIGRADRDRTTAAPDAPAAPAGGGEGRGADMVITEAEARGPRRRAGGRGQTAAQAAQAELASQAGARSMVAQMERDLTERRIVDSHAVVLAETAAVDAREGIAAREHEIAMQAVDDAAQAANDNARMAEMEDANLRDSLARHESYTGRLAELNNEQVRGAQRAAEFTNGAFESMGKAIGTHVQALIDGKESVGQALQGMLSDTLISVGKEAIVQGGMETAKGIAALAGVVTAPLALGHFAAAGAFFGVGAAAGIGGAALAPSAPAAGAGAGRGGAGGLLPDRAAAGAEAAGPTVVNNYYAPVIGGRTASEGESGMQINRLTEAERRRTQRAA